MNFNRVYKEVLNDAPSFCCQCAVGSPKYCEAKRGHLLCASIRSVHVFYVFCIALVYILFLYLVVAFRISLTFQFWPYQKLAREVSFELLVGHRAEIILVLISCYKILGYQTLLFSCVQLLHDSVCLTNCSFFLFFWHCWPLILVRFVRSLYRSLRRKRCNVHPVYVLTLPTKNETAWLQCCEIEKTISEFSKQL